MINLFMMGGPLFMGILSLVLIGVIISVVRYVTAAEKSKDKLDLIKSFGLLAAVIGVLGQLIGLFDALKFIEQAGQIAPGMLAGGIKVSMITTLYGLFIYVISLIIWLTLSYRNSLS